MATSTVIQEAKASAIFIGFIRMSRANFKGRLDAKCPCSGLWGRSTGISSSSTAGKRPLDIDDSRASPIHTLIFSLKLFEQSLRNNQTPT